MSDADRELAEAQAEYQKLKLETRLTRARSRKRIAELQAQLTESYFLAPPSLTGGWGELVDPLDRYRDGDRLVMPMGWQDRQDGRPSPLIQSEQELAETRSLARVVATTNLYGVGVVETIIDFTVGEGMTPKVSSKESAPKDLVAAAQDVIDEFYAEIEFEELQQELVSRNIVDGEAITRDYADADCYTIRTVEPEQIQAPPGEEHGRFPWGIENVKDDVWTPSNYAVWYGTPQDYEVVPADEITHCKRGVYRSVKRGLSDFFCATEALDGVRRLVRNLREGASLQSAIAWIEQYDAAQQAAVRGANAANQDYSRTNFSGRSLNYRKMEPGTIPQVPKGKTFLSAPQATNAAAHAALVQVALRGIAQRWGFTEYMISADASNANYSSTLVAGAPFVRRVKRWQRHFRTFFLRILWKLLKWAHDVGRLGSYSWEEICYLLDIQLEAPTPELANVLQDAQVDQIDMNLGVLSKRTRRLRRGLDDEQEAAAVAEDPVTPPAPAAPPQQQPAGGLGTFFPRLSLGG